MRILLPQIMESNIPLMRKKKDGTFTYIPPEDFDKYFKNTVTDLYINEEIYDRNKDIIINFNTQAVEDTLSHSTEKTVILKKTDTAFSTGLAEAGEMDMMERLQSTINSNYQIKSLVDKKSRFDNETASQISNAFSRILCMSKVTLEENIVKPISEDQMIRLVNEIEFAMDNLVTLLSNGESSFADLARLEFIQTGSNTLNHMNRMLIRMVSFLTFYNEYFTEYSNDIKRIRAHFKERLIRLN